VIEGVQIEEDDHHDPSPSVLLLLRSKRILAAR